MLTHCLSGDRDCNGVSKIEHQKFSAVYLVSQSLSTILGKGLYSRLLAWAVPELLWMEMFQRLGMVIDPLHVTEVREQSFVTNHSTVLALTVLKYHLHTQKCSKLQSSRKNSHLDRIFDPTDSLSDPGIDLLR